MAEKLHIRHRLEGPWITGILLQRRKRLLCDVRLAGGEEIVAHLADRGRLDGIMVPGAQVFVTHQPQAHRKTAYSLVMVRGAGQATSLVEAPLICVEPAGANRLVEHLLRARVLRPWTSLRSFRREVRHGHSRLDFEIEQENGRPCAVEVKSVVAVKGATGLFPDAPSQRGRKHCELLAALSRSGQDTAIILLAQRGDVHRIRPHRVDPEFQAALSDAKSAGVRVIGLRFEVSLEGFNYLGRIPVLGI